MVEWYFLKFQYYSPGGAIYDAKGNRVGWLSPYDATNPWSSSYFPKPAKLTIPFELDENGIPIPIEEEAPPVGINVDNYGVGTGVSEGIVSGKKTSFNIDEPIFIGWKLSGDVGGKTSTLVLYRKENNAWVQKWEHDYSASSSWTSFWHQVGITKLWQGEWKTEFQINSKVLKTILFTYGEIAPEPVPPKATILESTPSGAKIYVNGLFVGNTGMSLINLEADDEIRLELEGYETMIFNLLEKSIGTTISLKLEPAAPPEKTWWDFVLDFLVATPLIPYIPVEAQFKIGYKLLTGKEIDEEEYSRVKLRLMDWILPINVLTKLFTGKNLKGEPEEFGSAGDWLEGAVLLAAAIIPGQIDDAAVKLAGKTISKVEAAKLTASMGKKETVTLLTSIVRNFPESSAKLLASFPKPVREAVVKGLYFTAWGRIAIVTLSKMGYFKLIRPWWKSILVAGGATAAVAGLLVGAIGSYPFAGFIKEEALQTLGFAVLGAKDAKDVIGLRKALDEQAEILDRTLWEAFIAKIPYVNVVNELWDFYEAAKIKLDIDEAAFEGLKEEWEEEAAPVGTLIIRPIPEDAKVSVAGLIPTTGTFEKILPLASYDYTISKFGFISKSGTAEVKADEETIIEGAEATIEEEAEPIPPIPPIPPEEVLGRLIISVIPGDALIKIAGLPEIVTPGSYELAPGNYEVEASKEGFVSQKKAAFVSEKKYTVLSFLLEEVEKPEELPKKATLRIISEPAEADIYIDGKYTFTKTPYTTILEAGTYILRVQKDGFYPQEVSITLGEGDEIEVPFVLEAIPSEVIPEEPYIPYNPWFPDYYPDVPYIPDLDVTPYSQITPPDYGLLGAPVYGISPVTEMSKPVEKEILINVETTGVYPWESRLYSIAYLDLTTPGAEIQVFIDNDEKKLLQEFMAEFEPGNYVKLLGFNVGFDHRFIFNKLMLHRMQSKKFKEIKMRDVKQLMDQVQEAFVYNAKKKGTLDDYSKELLGRGKFGKQEVMLKRYLAGDFGYVAAFQTRQIELTRDLYDLFRFSALEGSEIASSPIPAAQTEFPITLSNPFRTSGDEKTCINCKAYQPITASVCEICGFKI